MAETPGTEQDRGDHLVEEFAAWAQRYREALRALDAGAPIAEMKVGLRELTKHATDRFVRRVALEWASMLPQAAPKPPSADLLRAAARTEAEAMARMRTQTIAQSLDTARAAAHELTTMFEAGGVGSYGRMFAVDMGRTASDLIRELDQHPEKASLPYAPRTP